MGEVVTNKASTQNYGTKQPEEVTVDADAPTNITQTTEIAEAKEAEIVQEA